MPRVTYRVGFVELLCCFCVWVIGFVLVWLLWLNLVQWTFMFDIDFCFVLIDCWIWLFWLLWRVLCLVDSVLWLCESKCFEESVKFAHWSNSFIVLWATSDHNLVIKVVCKFSLNIFQIYECDEEMGLRDIQVCEKVRIGRIN